MTLLVAGIQGETAWMVSDAAITGNAIPLREREYAPKIEVSNDGKALIGFAGPVPSGPQAIRSVVNENAPQSAISRLCEVIRSVPELEFAYAYMGANGPELVKITSDGVAACKSLFLGSQPAYELFQRQRLSDDNPITPLAFGAFMCGAKQEVPNALGRSIVAMNSLFASRAENDVGGWAIPYVLSASGAHFADYCHSFSDPLLDRLKAGAVVPHGTAQQGGSTLSVTGFGENAGFVVYWLQLPGGFVFRREADGYPSYKFSGAPSAFKDAVQSELGQDVHLWVNDEPAGPLKAVRVLRNDDGSLNCVIGDHGGPLSFAVHNLASPFESYASMGLVDEKEGSTVTRVDDDKRSVCVNVHGSGFLTLTTEQVDDLLFKLADARMEMLDIVPMELVNGVRTLAAFDPCWRTSPQLHPDLHGLALNLRHPGYGWLGFILPHHEARNLGQWLLESSQTQVD